MCEQLAAKQVAWTAEANAVESPFGTIAWAGTLLYRIPEANQECPRRRTGAGFPFLVFWPRKACRGIWAFGDQLTRRPNPSAMRDTTRVFKLTPSFSALAASLAWRLFGTRWTHFPLTPAHGAVIGSLNSFAVASQERSASEPFSTASSIVSPSAMVPGRSGNSTSQPPPSDFERRRVRKGYSIFFIGPLVTRSLESS